MGKSSDWIRPGARCRYQGSRLGKIVRLSRIAHREVWVSLEDDPAGPFCLRIDLLEPVEPVEPAPSLPLPDTSGMAVSPDAIWDY